MAHASHFSDYSLSWLLQESPAAALDLESTWALVALRISAAPAFASIQDSPPSALIQTSSNFLALLQLLVPAVMMKAEPGD
jgi:hypothetical protein